MCIVNKEAAFSVVVSTLDDVAICEVGFSSISLVCRFIDCFNFEVAKITVIRNRDYLSLDIDLLMEIWRNF